MKYQHVKVQHVGYAATATLVLCGLVFQESKRSAQELSGRSDGNMKVIFPKQEVPALDTGSCVEPIKLGDYILVKVEFSLVYLQSVA